MTDINVQIENQTPIDYSNDQISPAQVKFDQRQSINSAAGDRDSIQGSIADASQITMLALGQLLLQLKAGKSIDDIIASDSAFAACIEFANADEDGSMKVPFKQKPAGEAMADIVKRTHAVAELYAQ